MKRRTCRAIDAIYSDYNMEFYYRTAHGGKDTRKAFAKIGNAGIGFDFVAVLRELGHDVRTGHIDVDGWDDEEEGS